ncbi:hypothetical protein Tco_0724512 [Tanacetum coccineum]
MRLERGFRQGMEKGDRVALGGEDILAAVERTAVDRKTDRAAFAAVAIDVYRFLLVKCFCKGFDPLTK